MRRHPKKWSNKAKNIDDLGEIGIANKQYQDYELYVTVEGEDNQRDVEEDPEEDPERLASVAHYIMMHYAKKESKKKKQKRSTRPRQANTAWRPD